jgi:hypothetical protein
LPVYGRFCEVEKPAFRSKERFLRLSTFVNLRETFVLPVIDFDSR